jgi:LPXTG-motif cell wall-anchored protein
MKKSMTGVALATLMAFGAAMPAQAITQNVESTPWDLRDSTWFGIEQVGIGGISQAPYGAYAGDGFVLKLENPTAPDQYLGLMCGSGGTSTSEDDGDFVLECDNPNIGQGVTNITWDGTIKIFAGEYRGLVGRITYDVTNVSDAAAVMNWRFYGSTEECNSGVGNVATSSGDLAADTSDYWLLCNNNNNALEGIVWGTPWSSSVTNNNSNDPVLADNWFFDNDGVVLAPGDSLRYVFFIYSEGASDHGSNFGVTDAQGATNMATYFDTNTLYSSRLWEDLSVVDNWVGSGVAPEVPTLPDTGVNASGLLFAAFALLGLGAVIVVRRRSVTA